MFIIIPQPRRFMVKCDFDMKSIEFFRTIEARFWDKPQKTWSFPNSALLAMVSFLAENKIDFEYGDMKLNWDNDKLVVESKLASLLHSQLRKASLQPNGPYKKVGSSEVLNFESIMDIQNILVPAEGYKYETPQVDAEASFENVKSKKFRK